MPYWAKRKSLLKFDHYSILPLIVLRSLIAVGVPSRLPATTADSF